MTLLRSFASTVQLELVSADPAGLLTAINKLGITVFNVKIEDEVSIKLQIYYRDYRVLRQLIAKRGEQILQIHKAGIVWISKSVVSRPILLIFLILFLVATLYLPSRIFFVRVEGNAAVPTNQIIELASQCGIRFGASRREVRSEKVKNALINRLPQLQWVGVNTSGCIATIQVREKSTVFQQELTNGVTSVVAKRDGVVCDMTVLQGNPVCKVGQVVKQGQTLVSGYTDCGILIKGTQAKAEVYAQTNRTLTVIAPFKDCTRGQKIGSKRKISLKIGKKLINFNNDSGISDSSCVKMYKEHYLTLPGGFKLPVSIICQTNYYYENQSISASSDDYDWLESFCGDYLQNQMIAGKILNVVYAADNDEDVYRLSADFSCIEMIGQVRSEESLQFYGKDS